MKILILYKKFFEKDRNTITEHLYSFKNYYHAEDFCYVNVPDRIPRYLPYFKFDAVILHYTFLSTRFLPSEHYWQEYISNLKNIRGLKIAIPQDEYDETDRLCDLFKKYKVKMVFTSFTNKTDWIKAYPVSKAGSMEIVPVLTGYVDENLEKKIHKLDNYVEFEKKKIDIGYRARKLPYYFGEHSLMKTQLVEKLEPKLTKHKLRVDIKNTDSQYSVEPFMGDDWLNFLLRCKAVLGCEGGSSLLDSDGKVKRRVLDYCRINPDATFAKVKKICFNGKDNNIKCFTIGPRHFEAIQTKTLQILTEGKYNNILKPDVHYLVLKNDFSNIKKIVTILKDKKRCNKIINQAYEDIVLSGKYSYRKFVELIIDKIRNNSNFINSSSLGEKYKYEFLRFFLVFRNTETYRQIRAVFYILNQIRLGRGRISINIK